MKEIGVIGLGVMGRSLARNLGSRGFDLALYNRRVAGAEEDIALSATQSHIELSKASAHEDIGSFIKDLSRPRKMIIMVNAGAATEAVMNEVTPYLEPDDILIDGGNANYRDTLRRQEMLITKGIHWIGSGVSGGEKGALEGPSIMPGGDQGAYSKVAPYLNAIAAVDSNGQPCCGHIGKGGAGHFVKMIHNGIEYAEMQLIAEVYGIMRYQNHMSPLAIAQIFGEWNESDLKSYLLEITSKILLKKDDDGAPLIDHILDKAGNKGTGSWSTIAASEYGAPATMITAALFARYTSAYKNDRHQASELYPPLNTGKSPTTTELQHAYRAARMINHHQGIHLIYNASAAHEWQVNLNELARIWTNGCIIRSTLMERIMNMDMSQGQLMMTSGYAVGLKAVVPQLATVISCISGSALSIPCLSAALDFYKAYCQSQSTANIIQAQRDFFGAHTYKRTDDPEGPSYHTIWE